MKPTTYLTYFEITLGLLAISAAVFLIVLYLCKRHTRKKHPCPNCASENVVRKCKLRPQQEVEKILGIPFVRNYSINVFRVCGDCSCVWNSMFYNKYLGRHRVLWLVMFEGFGCFAFDGDLIQQAHEWRKKLAVHVPYEPPPEIKTEIENELSGDVREVAGNSMVTT